MPCPPDTDAKRLARFYLYRKVRRLWAAGVRPEGSAVVLAGSEASEIGCLRHYLSLPPNLVHFVDLKDDAGLKVVKAKWKDAQTFHGNVKDAIESLRQDLAFVNFDFCGYMKDDYLEGIDAAAWKMAHGGVVAYTFSRDRENGMTPNWELVQETAKRIMASKATTERLRLPEGAEGLDVVRFLGYSEILRSRLGKNFEVVFRLRYRGGSNGGRSMGMIALQNMPPHKRTPSWRKEHARVGSTDERVGSIIDLEIRAKLRDIAMELTDTKPAKEVACILHLPSPTLAAWQAHKTRGTYRRQEGGLEEEGDEKRRSQDS